MVFRLFFCFFLIFIQLHLKAQNTDTLDFDLRQFSGKGAFKYVKDKSSNTGLQTKTPLKSGHWEYFDKEEVLRVSGSYRVKGGMSFRTGTWLYYDTDGELVMKDLFTGNGVTTEYIKPCLLRTSKGVLKVTYGPDSTLHTSGLNYPVPAGSSTIAAIPGMDSTLFVNFDTIRNMDARNPNRFLLPRPGIPRPAPEKNLVNNGSFEDYDSRMRYSGCEMNNLVPSWRAASGTPDYYNQPDFNARQGNAAVGIRFHTSYVNHIEFLVTELKGRMQPGKTYCFRGYVRLRENCFYGVNALGVLFAPKVPGAQDLIDGLIRPSISHKGGAPLTFKSEWMELSCSYTAKGNERYLVFGSFASADSMEICRLKGNSLEAYYYVDDIQVFEMEDPAQCPCTLGQKEIPKVESPPKKFVVRNIFFDNDKWDLLPASFRALDSLHGVLLENPCRHVIISGHTSNTGSRERNMFLSQKRAEAVRDYLVSMGMEFVLFECRGFGPDQPMTTNETEGGRAMNRRVEFELQF